MSAINDFSNGPIDSRGYALVVSGRITFDDFVTATTIHFCTLPIGAYVINGAISVTTVWDISTSVLDVGNDGDDDEYTSTIINLENLQDTALTITNVPVASGADEEIELIVTSNTPTTGVADLFLVYVDLTKSDENFEGLA